MVTEFILLLLGTMLVISLFTNTLKSTFKDSSPKLGARVEKYLETGSGFSTGKYKEITWGPPPGKPGE